MNYTKHYDLLMERARSRVLTGYGEWHHVVPSCLGGSDDKSNLVRLTAEEHFVAHQLLVKMHPGHRGLLWDISAMRHATHVMVRNNKMYGWLRRRFAAMVSEMHRGRLVSDETRAKQSAARLGRKFAPHSAETKAKMSAASKGRKKSASHCAALASAKLGKSRSPHTEETREKMSRSQRTAWQERKAQKKG